VEEDNNKRKKRKDEDRTKKGMETLKNTQGYVYASV
jgi:hypothetical protein